MDPELRAALNEISTRLGNMEKIFAAHEAHGKDSDRRILYLEQKQDDMRTMIYKVMGGGIAVWALVTVGVKYFLG